MERSVPAKGEVLEPKFFLRHGEVEHYPHRPAGDGTIRRRPVPRFRRVQESATLLAQGPPEGNVAPMVVLGDGHSRTPMCDHEAAF
jgi:hypothetical protein